MVARHCAFFVQFLPYRFFRCCPASTQNFLRSPPAASVIGPSAAPRALTPNPAPSNIDYQKLRPCANSHGAAWTLRSVADSHALALGADTALELDQADDARRQRRCRVNDVVRARSRHLRAGWRRRATPSVDWTCGLRSSWSPLAEQHQCREGSNCAKAPRSGEFAKDRQFRQKRPLSWRAGQDFVSLHADEKSCDTQITAPPRKSQRPQPAHRTKAERAPVGERARVGSGSILGHPPRRPAKRGNSRAAVAHG